MKHFIAMVLVAGATAIYQPAKAQVSLQINIGSQPNWGPRGYDHVDYYYLPEIESYYYVPTRQFVYLERNKWVHRKSLPARYRSYNLHQGRKIVINEPRPYLRHGNYHASYSRPNINYRDNRRNDYRSYDKKNKYDHKSNNNRHKRH